MPCAAPGRWLGCGRGTRWARRARRAAPRRRHAPARRRRAAGAPNSPGLHPPPAAASGPPARAAPPCPRCIGSVFGLCLSRHRRQPRRALQASELIKRGMHVRHHPGTRYLLSSEHARNHVQVGRRSPVGRRVGVEVALPRRFPPRPQSWVRRPRLRLTTPACATRPYLPNLAPPGVAHTLY